MQKPYLTYFIYLLFFVSNITLGDENENSEGSRFVSVHPEQDSLSFIAKTSTYNLKDNIIKRNHLFL
mgnify:CR=1 FL=1